MSLNKYAHHIAQICPLHVYYSLHIDSTLLHIVVTKCKFHLQCYWYTSAKNKYAPEMLHIWHMPKFHNVHQWGKYANMQHMNLMVSTT